MATSFGQDFKSENRLSAKQIDMLDDLSGYSHGEVDPAYIIPARSLSALRKRGLVDDFGITAHGMNVLNAHI